MKRTVQTLFYQFQNRRLSEIPKIAKGLLNEGKEIVFLIAKRQEKP